MRLISTIVFCILEAGSSLAAERILGEPLEAGPSHEAVAGQVTIYGGGVFGLSGQVEGWSFVCSGISSGAVTPLLFERVSDTDFVLRAMGAFREISADGVYSGVRFDPEAGENIIQPNYTFGFADRVAYVPENPSALPIVTYSRHPGVIDYHPGVAGKWYYTSNQIFELRLGQLYRLNVTSEGDVVGLKEDAQTPRSYAAQMLGRGVAAQPMVSIYNAVEICWPSLFNQSYQVQWTGIITTNWQDLGEIVQGNGQTNCVFDSTRQNERRFYRILPVP